MPQVATKQISGLVINPAPALTDVLAIDNAIAKTYKTTMAQVSQLIGGLTWVSNTNASITLAKNNGYISDSLTTNTYALPVTAAEGEVYAVSGGGASAWSITIGSGQAILIGNDVFTGITTINSNTPNDIVYLICIKANSVFLIYASNNAYFMGTGFTPVNLTPANSSVEAYLAAIDAKLSGISWHDISVGGAILSGNTNYKATNAGGVALTMPASMPLDATVEVAFANGSSSNYIFLSSLQSLTINSETITASAGTITGLQTTANTLNQDIRILTKTANTAFQVTNTYGIYNTFSQSGVLLWLDANDPAGNGTQPANNTSMATIVDKSGNGYNATQSTGANQPVFVINQQNGLPVLVGTTVTSVTFTNSFILNFATDYSIMIVIKPAAQLSAGQFAFSAQPDSLNNRLAFFLNNSGDTSMYSDYGNISPGPGGLRVVSAEVGNFGVAYVHTAILNIASKTGYIYRGLTQTASVTIGAVPSFTPGTKTGQMIFVGNLCEVIVLNHSLSAAELSFYNNYFATKWGVTV